MAGDTSPDRRYRAEKAQDILVRPLDAMTLIYQRRSGITHIVAEPIPEILDVMNAEMVTAAQIAERLATNFDLGGGTEDIIAVIADRLEELVALGLVEAIDAA